LSRKVKQARGLATRPPPKIPGGIYCVGVADRPTRHADGTHFGTKEAVRPRRPLLLGSMLGTDTVVVRRFCGSEPRPLLL
jgi:hypothetical protein